MTLQNDKKLSMKDNKAQDKAYMDVEKVRYEGDIRDIFMQIQIYNDDAQLTGPGLKKLI
jgi:hypothetical protein